MFQSLSGTGNTAADNQRGSLLLLTSPFRGGRQTIKKTNEQEHIK